MKNQTSQYGNYLIFDVLESFLQSAAPEISSCQSMSRGKLLVLKKFRYVLNIHGLQLLIIDYKIEIHTGYMPILVLCIIPHISSAICNLTGFCNGSGITGQPFQIKSNSQFFIPIQLTLQRSAGFFLSWSWYTLRVLTSFPPLWIQKTPESFCRKKRRNVSSFHLQGMQTPPQLIRCMINRRCF